MSSYTATEDWPTVLATQGYKKIGIDSPTSDQLTRAETYFLPELLNDISMKAGITSNKRLKSLQSKQIQISVAGQAIYNASTDMDEEISVSILNGPEAGIVQESSATTTVTLSSTVAMSSTDLTGSWVLITSGTGNTEFHEIIGYLGSSTHICTLATSFGTQPVSTSTYLIVNEIDEVDRTNILDDGGMLGMTFDTGKPTEYTKLIEDGVTKFYFDRPFDATGTTHAFYGILTRYYADMMKLDTTGVTRNKIYLNWQDTLTKGMAKIIALDEDDSKYRLFKTEYETALANLLEKEIPWGGVWEGFSL